jgi:hypothetical protein
MSEKEFFQFEYVFLDEFQGIKNIFLGSKTST